MSEYENLTGNVQGGTLTGTLTPKSTVSGAIRSGDIMSGDIMHTVLKGISAYQDAVNHGFVGTVEEWLASLGATIAVGSVASGTPLSITNSGTAHDAVFDFVIPDPSAADIANLAQSDTVIFYCGSASEVM